MTQREVIQVLTGLMLAMFVAIVSSTVVSTSLPRIIADLGGGQSAYTWVVTASLLAMTVSTPIWGKFADLFDRKMLLQVSLIVFVVSSALAGQSQGSEMLIAFRVLQGLGTGGLMALVQIVMADIISPRDRGRYMGVLGAIMSVGTIGGPLLGGVITDALNWRWNFYVGVPIAAVALVVIQKTLILPERPKRAVSIDYLGAVLISSGVSLLLIWVSLGGSMFSWGAPVSILMVAASVALLVGAYLAEQRAAEPIIPLDLFRNRTVSLAVIGSIGLGVMMFSTSVYLSQYMQLARGQTPTVSGMFTIPMVLGSLASSTFGGQYITRTGIWKPIMVAGSVLTLVGYAGLGTLRVDTNLVLLCIYMALVGLGSGAVMQNMVLVVQNVVPVRQLGVASSLVTFFRSLGGAAGVAVLGVVLGSRVTALTADGLARIGVQSEEVAPGVIPDLSTLPEPVRMVVESAYGQGVGNIYMLIVPLAMITIVAVAKLPNIPLGTKSGAQQMAEESTVQPDPAKTTGATPKRLKPTYAGSPTGRPSGGAS
jgi:EmrB/QacA subfamily drug resistance transporter